jgi:hypothetical protein
MECKMLKRKNSYMSLSAASLAIGFAALMSSGPLAASENCDLTIKGTGRHSCQCDVLVHHRAEWKILMHLSDLNVCDSPTVGGGSGSNQHKDNQIEIFVESDCANDTVSLFCNGG